VAGVAANVFEAQVFGHLKGAFTGAHEGALGIVVAHDGGAVLLDEIGELAPELQVKLLRLLENREVMPVGASHPVRVDVVLVAATNRDLEAMVQSGSFREDLYARLAIERLDLPPLCQRVEDIFAIGAALAPETGLGLESDDPNIEVEAIERLLLHSWPQNVRELKAVLGRVDMRGQAGLARWAVDEVLGELPAPPSPPLTEEALSHALQATENNQQKAAALLGVSRSKFIRHAKKFGLL
jgi:transcriptional regulator with PAS, ATPase and Fis domain